MKGLRLLLLVLLASPALAQTATPTNTPTATAIPTNWCCQSSISVDICEQGGSANCIPPETPVANAVCQLSGGCATLTPTAATPTFTPTPTNTPIPSTWCCTNGIVCANDGVCPNNATAVPNAVCNMGNGHCVTFTPTPTITPTQTSTNTPTNTTTPALDCPSYITSLLPISWKRFGDPAGSSVATDQIDAAFNGTYLPNPAGNHPHLGVAGATNDGNTAVSFAIGDGMLFPAGDSVFNSTSISVAMWFKTTNHAALLTLGTRVDSTDLQWAVQIGALGNLVWSVGTGSSPCMTSQLLSSAGYNDGAYHLFTGTFEPLTGDIEIYIDGVLNNNNTVFTGGGLCALSSGASGLIPPNGSWSGTLDEPQIYSYVLTSGQILSLFQICTGVNTPTPTNTRTNTPTPTPTRTPTNTNTPTNTPTQTFTQTASPTTPGAPTFTPTQTRTFTRTSTLTPTPTPTPIIRCITYTPASTPTPVAACPYTFADATGDLGSTCYYKGPYNLDCGTLTLTSAFAGDGRNVSIILGTSPTTTFTGRVTSPVLAALTQVQAGTFPAQPVSATGRLVTNGTTLAITLNDDQPTYPFAICDLPLGCSPVQDCPFAFSIGTFQQVISPAAPPPAVPISKPVWNEVPYPTKTPTPTLTPTRTPSRTPTALPSDACCNCTNPDACSAPVPGMNCGSCTVVFHAALQCINFQPDCATVTPTPTLTPRPSSTPTQTPTKTRTPTPINSRTFTPTNTPGLASDCCDCLFVCGNGVSCPDYCTVHHNAACDLTPLACKTYTPTITPTQTPTSTPTITPTQTPTQTPTRSRTPTNTP